MAFILLLPIIISILKFLQSIKIQTRHCYTSANRIHLFVEHRDSFRNRKTPNTWASAGLLQQQQQQQQCRKQHGDAYLPDKCSNKHQHTASAMCWLWYWSLSTPNSLCVNYKHKICTLSGETGFQAHCCCKSSPVNTEQSSLCHRNSCCVPW